MTHHSHAGFQEFMQGWKTMDPNCRVEVVRQLVADDGVAKECLFHATHSGPLHTPMGEIPPIMNYPDGVTFMTQLGLLPALGVQGT